MKPSVETIENNIQELRKALSGKTLLRAARNGGLVILNGARILVPVDTGALRADLSVEDSETTNTQAWVNVGSHMEYAEPVELGHVTRSGSHVPAQPYLRPPADENKSEIVKVIAATIRKIIEAAL